MVRYILKFSIALLLLISVSCKSSKQKETESDEMEENEKYDNPQARELQEFNQTKDITTGTVPIERLWTALDYTLAIKNNFNGRGIGGIWIERGPIYDSVGPSNGNGRGGGSGYTGAYTSGRITGFLVDAADATGNTIFCGGVNGGIWKCTNFTSTTTAPNWESVNDYLSNMSIVSFCQNPLNKDIMYVATGEGYNSADASRGRGIFKSIDHGVTWTSLASTTAFTSSFKILCDGLGNIYWASRGGGLKRSTNGGTTFSNIHPSGQTNCTDIELSSNGKLYASFGYNSSTVSFKYANNPATVTSALWSNGSGSPTAGRRLELATKGDTIYGVTTNNSSEVDFCYRSVNAGASWTKMNAAGSYPTITNGQGWFALSLAVNPNDANQIIVGSVDGYLSTDGGASVSSVTRWIGFGTYVHADHHLYQWWLNSNNQSRMIIACDGGLYYSEDDAGTFVDKNQNLNIKQFYSCAIHPTKTNYMLAGAQDNGVHQLKNAGLSYSIEVTGGDGGFVDIDNDQPQYQFGSYTNNNYRRSSNNGISWSAINISSSTGSFINPYDYDDVQNVMFCGNNTNDFLRWTNPQSNGSPSTSAVTLTELGGNASTFQASPYKLGRLFVGSSNGSIVMVDNSKTTTGSGSADVVSLGSPAGGYTSCIAIGTNDSNLLAVYSNYGINNLWITNDMGSTWTAIDGNLPDMPVRWAVFHPTINNAIVIATEAGVFTATNVNGASTQWTVSADFPLVRVSMLKVRKSDNTIIAATYGRGMWSTNILNLLPLKKIDLIGKLERENDVQLNWQMIDATNNAKYFLEYSEDGLHFDQIIKMYGNTSSFKHTLTSSVGYYRIMGVEPNMSPVYSNVISIKSNKKYKGLQVNIAPNPMNNNGKIMAQSSLSGEYSWNIYNVQGNILQTGRGTLQAGLSVNVNALINKLSSGMYVVSVTQNNQTKATSFIKQ